ncbi:MAG: hypothetical protein ABIH26_13950 [Candidatus Eisenbacteria bacterium]
MRIHRLPRAFLRYGQIHREQWLSPEELDRRQWRRFQEILRHAFQNCRFYRERFERAGITPDDVRERRDIDRIPVTTREDLRKPANLLSAGRRPEKMESSTTSGSEGRRTIAYFDRDAWLLGKHLLKLRARLACGVRPWDRVALLQEGSEANKGTSRPLVRAASFSIERPESEILPALLLFKPTVLYGFPSFLLRLSEAGVARLRPRLIFTSGEMLGPGARRTIERSFGATVYDIYGSTEVKEISWECPRRRGYHINADWLLLETPGAESGDGRPGKELLVTSLYNFGMPLIRYRLGDTGRLLEESCPCGRSLPLMMPVLGRSVDYFSCPDGTAVAPYALTGAVEKVEGVAQYRIVQEQTDRVVVSVIPAFEFDESKAEEIRRALSPLLPGVHVTIVAVEMIARDASGKYRIVESRIRANGRSDG